MISTVSNILEACVTLPSQIPLAQNSQMTEAEGKTAKKCNAYSVAMKVTGLLLLYYTGKGYWNAIFHKDYNILGLAFRIVTFIIGYDSLILGNNLYRLYCVEPSEQVAVRYIQAELTKAVQKKRKKEESFFGQIRSVALDATLKVNELSSGKLLLPEGSKERQDTIDGAKITLTLQNSYLRIGVDYIFNKYFLKDSEQD